MLQRPHQMALALAERGHQVSFISPNGLDVTGNNPTVEEMVSASIKFKRQIRPGLDLFLTVRQQYYAHCTGLVQWLLSGSTNEVVVVCYLPGQAEVIGHLKGKLRVVYECVDDHSDTEFSFWSRPGDIEREQDLVDRADLVLTTSSALYLDRSFGRNNVYLSKNAVPLDTFRGKCSVPDDLAPIPSPRVCYVGAVHDWFDENLFYRVVESNSALSFVVIGPVKTGLLERRYPNLYLLGVKPHDQLVRYMTNSDAGIIPFRADIDLVVHCDPIKMYEYLACGLPVVSTALPEAFVDVPLVHPCRDADEFTLRLREVIRKQTRNATNLASFLAKNTWKERADQLDRLLDGCPLDEDLKPNTLKRLRRAWKQSVCKQREPLLCSLYGLTFGESNPDKFLRYAKEAYSARPTRFTLRYYVLALFLTGNVSEIVDVLLDDAVVTPLQKAELMFALKQADPSYITSQVFMCVRKYDLVRDLLESPFESPELSRQASGHYWFATGQTEKALAEYLALLDHPDQVGPTYWHNLSEIVRLCGQFRNAEVLRFKAEEMVESLLGLK